MGADVNEVCRLLGDRNITYKIATTGQDVRWTDEDGVQWAYYGKLYSSRDSRLCAYGIDPKEAVRKAVS